LKVPVTIITGTQDKIVDFGQSQLGAPERAGSAGSELQLEPGVGHMTHYAHPDKVIEAIDAIAARVGEPVRLRDPKAEALARASESGT
jgi:pimeloyl-ACP methyl ester carboxylesterase